MSWLFFAGLLGVSAGAADVSFSHAVSVGPHQSFSIADFDHDSKPDLVSVQPGKSNGPSTDYWVDVRLSAAERQSFRVVAPLGSVQVASRDVNGDHILDLVVTSTWLKQPVAILLNDGHGTFSQVDPAVFPEASRQSQASLVSESDQQTDAVGVPPRSREHLNSEIDLFLHGPSRSRFTFTSDLQFVIDPFLVSHSGRAPPFESSLLS